MKLVNEFMKNLLYPTQTHICLIFKSMYLKESVNSIKYIHQGKLYFNMGT